MPQRLERLMCVTLDCESNFDRSEFLVYSNWQIAVQWIKSINHDFTCLFGTKATPSGDLHADNWTTHAGIHGFPFHSPIKSYFSASCRFNHLMTIDRRTPSPLTPSSLCLPLSLSRFQSTRSSQPRGASSPLTTYSVALPNCQRTEPCRMAGRAACGPGSQAVVFQVV